MGRGYHRGAIVSGAGRPDGIIALFMEPTFSCVAYANTIPYVSGLRLLPGPERPRLLLDPPYRCAERLRSGEASVALVPSIEWARSGGAHRAGPFGIAARREVRSVLLFSKRPPEACRRIAVDSNSRTSVALLQVLLSRRFGSRPELVAMPPEAGAMLGSCDAALLIGDAALRARPEGAQVTDLAEAWNDMTALPFVFAVWAACDEPTAGRAAAVLGRALALGREHLGAAVRREAAPLGLTESELHDYLTRRIHFELGPLETRSLDLFFDMCREEGILQEARQAVQDSSGT